MTPKSSPLPVAATRVASDLIDELIRQLQGDKFSLTRCSLVSKRWREGTLKWLFAVIAVEIAAWNPWKYLRWFGEVASGFHLATTHARELHLVQYPSFMWIRPSMLEPILPRFTTFQSVTSLSFYSLSVRHFEGADIQSIFGHFFQTVRKLVLEDTCATARGLFHFLCNFHALDDLSISNPEWDHEIEVPQAAEASAFPSLHGTLSLRRLGANSADFVGLLAGLSTSFRRIWLVDCQLPSMQINLLLKRLAPSQAHPCIDAHCAPTTDFPPGARAEGIQFLTRSIAVAQGFIGQFGVCFDVLHADDRFEFNNGELGLPQVIVSDVGRSPLVVDSGSRLVLRVRVFTT